MFFTLSLRHLEYIAFGRILRGRGLCLIQQDIGIAHIMPDVSLFVRTKVLIQLRDLLVFIRSRLRQAIVRFAEWS